MQIPKCPAMCIRRTCGRERGREIRSRLVGIVVVVHNLCFVGCIIACCYFAFCNRYAAAAVRLHTLAFIATIIAIVVVVCVFGICCARLLHSCCSHSLTSLDEPCIWL